MDSNRIRVALEVETATGATVTFITGAAVPPPSVIPAPPALLRGVLGVGLVRRLRRSRRFQYVYTFRSGR